MKYWKAFKYYLTLSVMGVYVHVIRPVISFLVYHAVALWRRRDLRKANVKWSEIRDLTPQKFSNQIKKYDYQNDPFFGVIDYSLRSPEFFFLDRVSRDCDDYARMWFWWADRRLYDVWEIVITEPLSFARSHVFTVYKDCGKFYVCDYSFSRKQYRSLKDAVESRNYRNPVWVISRKSISFVSVSTLFGNNDTSEFVPAFSG